MRAVVSMQRSGGRSAARGPMPLARAVVCAIVPSMPKRPPVVRPVASRPGTSRPERMLAAAALIDQALVCLRSHPDEADARLRDALQVLGVQKRAQAAPSSEQNDIAPS